MTHYISRGLDRFLARLTSRSVLRQAEREAILRLPCRAHEVRANQDFVRQGERVEHACLTVTGLVGRFEQNPEGVRQITALYVPGDMADLHSVVQPTATYALQALSVATIFTIPHAAIRALTMRYPAIADALWRDCMVDAAVFAQWVVNVGRRNARARIAHLLCEMATRLAEPESGEVVFSFPITQTQLGDATALTPVHVNRTLMGLRGDGLITMRGDTVWIHDWDALVTVGEFDANYLHINERPQAPQPLAEAV